MSPDGLQASIEKMRAEGLGDAVIDTFAHYYEQLVVKQNFDVQIVSKGVARERPTKSNQRKIETSITKLRQVQRRSYYVGHMHYEPRMLKGYPLNDRRQKKCNCFRATDPDISNGRIR
jgi:hypothetical protein